jgi:O-antigen biosynthesis protein
MKFEQRCLALMTFFAKSIWLNAEVNLIALANVIPGHGFRRWRASNNDPSFNWPHAAALAGKRVLVLGRVLGHLKEPTTVKFYFDTGKGFSEQETQKIQPMFCGWFRSVVDFPPALTDIRVDPIEEYVVDFRFRLFVIQSRFWVTLCLLVLAASQSIDRRGAIKTLSMAVVGWRRHGTLTLVSDLTRKQSSVENDKSLYQLWIKRNEPGPDQYPMLREQSKTWASNPKFSVVMPTYNSRIDWLNEAIQSVKDQVYGNWELCIADDASTDSAVRGCICQWAAEDERIKFVFRQSNGHISSASNSALEIATGDYVVLLDHDDRLHPLALHEVASVLQRVPNAKVIFSDEDKITPTNERTSPYFKSDFDYFLFLSHNMVSHLGVYSREMLRDIGGFRSEFDGAQDYDLALRSYERSGISAMVHIPKVLYHWRLHPESTSSSGDAKSYAHTAAQRAISEHLDRIGRPAKVVPAPSAPGMNRVIYTVSNYPTVTIIVPTKDNPELLAACISSIKRLTRYPNFSILVVNNGSRERKTLDYFAELTSSEFAKILNYPAPFNFSAINNFGVKHVDSELICLLNDDTEVLSEDWLSEMVSLARLKNVGAVGAKLWYPDGKLQHAGVVLGVTGVCGHVHRGISGDFPGYLGRAVVTGGFSAVTAACLVIECKKYLEVGGLDEVNLAVAFNDVDFCLRLQEIGYANVLCPYAELVHKESASRGYENTPEKRARFQAEIDYMQRRHALVIENDPHYSPHLSRHDESFSIA